jgi:hypothetical protein
MMTFLVISSLAIFAVGAWVRHIDVVKKKNAQIDRRKLTPLQIIYSVCFAYPFCVFYLWLENIL